MYYADSASVSVSVSVSVRQCQCIGQLKPRTHPQNCMRSDPSLQKRQMHWDQII
jgi:hypothetical protein